MGYVVNEIINRINNILCKKNRHLKERSTDELFFI